jgi:hypothetical protein
MFKAAEENQADTVEEIFKNGLHPDATDKFGNSVIVIAATMGSLDVVKSAVAAGCDVNKPASSGETALALAKKGLTHAIVRGGDKDRDKFGSVGARTSRLKMMMMRRVLPSRRCRKYRNQTT